MNTPFELVVKVPEHLADLPIRKEIQYSDDTVINITVQEQNPDRYCSGNGPDFTFYTKGRELVRFNVNDVVYLEASSNYTILHFKNGSTDRTRIEFKKFEQQLSSAGYVQFVRIHTSFIINGSSPTRVQLTMIDLELLGWHL